MQVHNLSDFTHAELAAVFNQAFADYLLPVTLSQQQLSEKILTENIRQDHSVGVTINNRLVAFIFTGIDKDGSQVISYNAGTGVIPEFRGMGLVQKMYGYLLPFLQELDISRHQLEVITQNAKAVHLYRQIGYQATRTVSCFKGVVTAPSAAQSYPCIKCQLDDEQPVRMFWNQEPTYQNRFSAINRNPALYETLGAFDGQQLIGYIIYAGQSGRIKQFGVHPDYRKKGVGHQLFHAVQQTNPGLAVSIINCDNADDQTQAFLRKIGLDVFIEQYEMVLKS